MKVRIVYTVEVDDEFRAALRAYYGAKGLATREEVREHYRDFGGTARDDIMHEYQLRKESTPCSA